MAGETKRAGFVAWLVALVVPPAVAGELGQRFVAQHAAWAVVIGVAYEVAVAIGGFFAVIARDVSSRWQARLADRIDLFLQRKAAHFERRYRQFVLGGLRFMDHKGLATVGPFTPELDAVFVNVSLVPRPPQKIEPGILPGLADARAGHRVLGDFLGRNKPAVLAVVGSPGSGKTTLLRHAARQACQRKSSRRNRQSRARDIPILLYLRDHAAAITADPAIPVAALLRATLGAAGTEEPPGWFEQQLNAGRCLVLLDGLDEVARQEDRARVSAWAEGQVRQYPGNDFVISSRPQGYQSAPVEGADIVQVCGFTDSQVEAFVRGWYRAVERHSTGSTGPEVEELAREGAGDLLRRLEQAPALDDLTVNPLLLTMIANVHKYRGALPGSRADLYAEICQVMLWRRQDAKNLPQQISGDKKEAILRGLAYTMMQRRVSDLSHADVRTAIQPTLRRMARGAAPDDFLADVSSNGLLIERETSQYAFAHKTFQEYLAAAYIRDNGLVGDLANAVSDDWWAETTLLYAATSNADPIVQACLNANTAAALVLALDCTDQDSDLDPDLRKRVNDLVISAASPDADPERRRLFADILLTRHMRQRKRTTGGTQVCAQPIPAEIYRLFLADTQTPEPDAPLTESGIAVGMRSSDASAFVQWANALSGGQQSYRLPLAAELTELAAQQRIPALPSGRSPCPWIQSTRTLPVLWLPPDTPKPYELSNVLLAKAFEVDVVRSPLALDGLLLWSRIMMRALALDRDRESAGDLGIGYDLGLGFHRDLVRDLARDLARDMSHACVPDLALVVDLAVGLAEGLDRGLGVDAVLDLALILAVKIYHYMPSNLRYGQARQIFDTTCRLVLGRAFSDAISETVQLGNQSDGLITRFTGAFIDAAGVRRAGHVTANPENMGAMLYESVKKLEGVLGEEQADMTRRVPTWFYGVARHLKRTAGLVFAGIERPTREKATAIRMAVLCLAAEADAMERKDIGSLLWQVAAGITLLERRTTGELQADEVITLAVKRTPFEVDLPARQGRRNPGDIQETPWFAPANSTRIGQGGRLEQS